MGSGTCNDCGASVLWMKTLRGKNIMVEAESVEDGYDGVFDRKLNHVCHWDVCPTRVAQKEREEAEKVQNDVDRGIGPEEDVPF